MKSVSLLAFGLLVLTSSACQRGKFSEDKAAAESFEVTVVEGENAPGKEADASADATAQIEIEGNDGAGAEAGKDKDKETETETGTGTESKADDKGKKDGNDDAGACADAASVSKDRVKVSGSEKKITLSPTEAFALKVTGNSNVVTVKITASDATLKLPALCIFVAGNQNHVVLDIGMTVGQIYVKARGNQALVDGTVSKDGVIESIQVDAKGHQPQIVLQGKGSSGPLIVYPCFAEK